MITYTYTYIDPEGTSHERDLRDLTLDELEQLWVEAGQNNDRDMVNTINHLRAIGWVSGR